MKFPLRPASFDGFVHRAGHDLVDGDGRTLLLRGMGIGNWMLPEGYMWKFGPGAESPREIEALVSRLIPHGADAFWRDFRDNFFTENDVARIAQSGFDHIRLPINSRLLIDERGTFIEAGFAMIDDTIRWCRANNLWVLLDLHGAPGGQTGTNIDDSPNNKPELFMEARYRTLTIDLWTEIARRYANETVVMGYDLLNEPIPNEWTELYNPDLARLYIDLTAAIRAVDSKHLIMYEGSHWATNWHIFSEVWDENSCLQFHKYWSPPDRATIEPFLEARERLGLPIYMGEGGENNLEWLYTAWRLYENFTIGWNFWPWKKIDTRTSPASITPPARWAELVEHVAGGTVPDDPQQIFDELLNNMKLDNCVWQPAIIQAITAIEPQQIPAWGFGFRGRNLSYATHSSVPLKAMRDTDAVSILYLESANRDGHWFEQTDGRDYSPSERLAVTLAAGDWLEYELDEPVDPARITIDDGTAPLRVLASERGFIVTATASATFARIRISP
ncbi:MAG: glycoside hydrolase family 5 protein [Microbacteriaceae bacterium]